MACHPVDVHVGNRLRLRRRQCGLSQKYLAEKVGVSFQQIQKYERGANRIAASKIYQFSILLHRSPTWFFRGLDGFEGDHIYGSELEAVLNEKETLQLVNSYYGISKQLRKEFLNIIKSCATIKSYRI